VQCLEGHLELVACGLFTRVVLEVLVHGRRKPEKKEGRRGGKGKEIEYSDCTYIGILQISISLHYLMFLSFTIAHIWNIWPLNLDQTAIKVRGGSTFSS